MKQLVTKVRITELAFLLFVLAIPLQLRTILNFDAAYIDYYFSYHKAILVYFSDILFLTFLVSWILFDRIWDKLNWVIFLAILGAAVSMFHVEQWDLWSFGMLKIAQFWLILTYLRQNPRLFHPIVWILIISGWFQAILAITQFHMQQGLNLWLLGEYLPLVSDSGAATISAGSETFLRPYGTFPHPNVLGGFLAICFCLWLYVSRGTITGWRNWIYVSCGTFLLLWGLILTFSRSAWLATVLAIGVALVFHLIAKQYNMTYLWAFLLIVSCGTLVLAYKTYVLPRSTDVSSQSSAASYRSEFNGYGWEIVKTHPLTGVGMNQYVPYLEQSKNLAAWQYQPAHNIFIFTWAEIGIIGLMTGFLALYWLGFTWNNLKNYSKHISIGLCAVILVLGLFDHYLVTMQQGKLLLAVCLGLILAYSAIEKRFHKL